jgi:hypothetical protein
MRPAVESSQREVKVWPSSAIVVLSLLIIGIIFLASAPPVGACNAPTQSATATPPCMRRVSINSDPCGAVIYIDGMQLGETPRSFPMSTGRYTLVLLAPGHEQYTQRILVPENGPLEVNAKLVPVK